MGKNKPKSGKHGTGKQSGKGPLQSRLKLALTIGGLGLTIAAAVITPKIFSTSDVVVAKSYPNQSCQVVKGAGFYDFAIQPTGSRSQDAVEDSDAARMVRLVGVVVEGNGNPDLESISGMGTGYNIGGGLILTAAHVVEADNNRMYTDVLIKYGSTGNKAELGKLVAWDKKADIALVKHANTKFKGIRLREPVAGDGVDALVIDALKDSVRFEQEDVKRFPFKVLAIPADGRGKTEYTYIAQNENLVRPGMSGSLVLSGAAVTGVLTEVPLTTTSYGLKGVVSQEQVLKGADARAVIGLLRSYCKNS